MPMKVATSLHPHTPLGPAIEWAKQREALGFDALWYGEAKHNPFLTNVLMAEHTEHVRFGPNIAVAFARTPHVTANLAWDLQQYSGGRFCLGLGTQVKGHNERRFSVPWGPPNPRLREYVECMRAIWDSWQHGTKPDYEGKYYRYQLTSWNFNPGPIEHPDIKVLLAAVRPLNTRLAAEVGDGVLFHTFMSWKWRDEVLIPAFTEGARRSGRDPKDLVIHGGGRMVVAKDEAGLQAELAEQKRWISFYASTRTYQESMQQAGFGEEAQHLHRLSIDGRWDEMPHVVTDEMLDEYALIATWDELPAKMRERYGGVSTEVTFSPKIETPEDAEQVREIVAELKQIPTFGEIERPGAVEAPTR